MTPQIRVAKSGKNALTSTDPNDFIFHSDYNTFKILKEGTLTSQSVTGDPTTFQIAHNQSIIPAIFAFAKYPDGYVSLPQESDYSNGTQKYWLLEADNTNIYFLFYKNGAANYNVDIKYYVFETPIA